MPTPPPACWPLPCHDMYTCHLYVTCCMTPASFGQNVAERRMSSASRGSTASRCTVKPSGSGRIQLDEAQPDGQAHCQRHQASHNTASCIAQGQGATSESGCSAASCSQAGQEQMHALADAPNHGVCGSCQTAHPAGQRPPLMRCQAQAPFRAPFLPTRRLSESCPLRSGWRRMPPRCLRRGPPPMLRGWQGCLHGRTKMGTGHFLSRREHLSGTLAGRLGVTEAQKLYGKCWVLKEHHNRPTWRQSASPTTGGCMCGPAPLPARSPVPSPGGLPVRGALAWPQEGVALELVTQQAGHSGLPLRTLGHNLLPHALQVCRCGASGHALHACERRSRRPGTRGGWQGQPASGRPCGSTPCAQSADAVRVSKGRQASPAFPPSTCAANLALLSVYSCAQYTRVSPGSGASLLRLAHICAGVPSNSRPQPRLNSVSPAGRKVVAGGAAVESRSSARSQNSCLRSDRAHPEKGQYGWAGGREREHAARAPAASRGEQFCLAVPAPMATQPWSGPQELAAHHTAPCPCRMLCCAALGWRRGTPGKSALEAGKWKVTWPRV